ncbi:MAG TPA: hypothetical protein VM165_24010 [Planctomycetaceae bacterium]|nr:hypothetical protein [Planctomycetaceae bacterium]
MVANQPQKMNAARPAASSRLAVVVLGVLCLAEAVKLVAFHLAGPAPLDGDAAAYWALGEQVARGDVWMVERPVGFRTPGYPWLLGLMQRLSGSEAWRAVILGQHAAVGLTTVLTGWWVWQLSGSLWLTNLAIGLRCVSLAAASYAGTVLTEPLYQPVFLATLMVLTSQRPVRLWRRWTLLGVLFATGFLLRPANAGVTPAMALAAVLECWPLGHWRARLRGVACRLAIVGGIGAVIIGPWCVRNAMIFGQPSPVIFLGRELWMSVFGPGRPLGPELPSSPEADRIRTLLTEGDLGDDWRVNWTTSGVLTGAGLSDAEADDLMKTVAVQGFLAHPSRTALRAVQRQVDFWRTIYSRSLYLYGDALTADATPTGQTVWGSDSLRARRARWLDLAPECWLLVIELGSLFGLVGALGLLMLPATWRAGAVVMTVLLVMDLLSGALDIPNYRLRMILEPMLIAGGVSGGMCWWTVLRRGLQITWHSETNASNASSVARAKRG